MDFSWRRHFCYAYLSRKQLLYFCCFRFFFRRLWKKSWKRKRSIRSRFAASMPLLRNPLLKLMWCVSWCRNWGMLNTFHEKTKHKRSRQLILTWWFYYLVTFRTSTTKTSANCRSNAVFHKTVTKVFAVCATFFGRIIYSHSFLTANYFPTTVMNGISLILLNAMGYFSPLCSCFP